MSSAVALVAGATGLVGEALLRDLARDPAWGEVRALTRRPLSLPANSPVVPIQVDYDQLAPPPAWARADHVFCALGTTMRQAGSREAFRRVDFDYPLGLARAAHVQGARHFLLVSSVGASTTSRLFYSRVKGEIEAAIGALGFRSVTIARPSFLVGQRADPRPGERLGIALARMAPRRWRSVDAARVARALINAAKPIFLASASWRIPCSGRRRFDGRVTMAGDPNAAIAGGSSASTGVRGNRPGHTGP